MKVIYLANGLPHYFNLVLSKLNAMPGVDLLVVIPKGPGKYIGDGVFQSKAGINFRIIELREYSVEPLFAAFAGLSGLLLRERPDVVVLSQHLLLGFFLHPGLLLARKISGARLVLKSIPFLLADYKTSIDRLANEKPISFRGKVLEMLRLRKLLRRALLELRAFCFRTVDAHVNYVDAAREVYGSYGVRLEKIFVTRNSPDTDAMKETEKVLMGMDRPPVRSPYSVLHVGRLVQQKRVDLLLAAFQSVLARVPEARLVVVGDGPERKTYEALSIKLGISGSVHFAGPVYESTELARYFFSASIFVLPGLGGLSINEAMFYGLAIVCAAGDGTERYLVREGHNGAFFQNGDAESLAGALIGLLLDSQKLDAMRQHSKSIIECEVNIHTVVSEYMKAFQYAISARR